MNDTMNYGQRDASLASEDLRGRMAMSPTGRQLVSDGSLVAPTYLTDPADVMLSPANGQTVIWDDTTGSGNIYLSVFVRGIGWLYVQVSA